MMVFSIMPIANVSAHSVPGPTGQLFACHGEPKSPWTHTSAIGLELEAIDVNDNGFVCVHSKTGKTIDDSKTNKVF